ncbi:MAG TPA: L,D-transpeptidase family protein [Thermoanaerobaculia bacterium]|nr:L,D-transpeptidase family protein [Thermoanaerobaculia bacterium]
MRLHLWLASALLLGACTFEDASNETAEQPTPVRETQEGESISVPSRDYARYDPASVQSQRLDPSWRQYAERDRQRRRGMAQQPQTGQPGMTSDTTASPQLQPPLTSDLGVDPSQSRTPPTGAESPGPPGRPGASSPPASPGTESFETISPQSVQAAPTLPIPEEGGGSTALRTQILLDRARFSPGVLDGYWGKNTEKAVYWFQEAQGMNSTGKVDRATWDALNRAAGPQRSFLRQMTVTAEDLNGPFVQIPEDVYAKSELDCLCYTSPLERLAERTHSTAELLKQLNPQADLENLTQGTTLWVPDVPPIIPARVAQAQAQGGQDGGAQPAANQAQRTQAAQQTQPAQQGATGQADSSGQAQRLVISKKGFYLHGVDGQGNIVFHLPTTLGSDYDPSPGGEYKVTLVKRNPDFHYQPKLFHEVPDTEKDAFLPAGPNSPVGLVWMQLSKPNYGIHGTAVPDTIGYTSSHGCIRLTNWDALFLADRIQAGVQVEFVD